MTTRKSKPLKKITLWFSSQTIPGIKYKTERHRDGKTTCFCEGWVYGVQNGRSCKHVKRMAEVALSVDTGRKLPPLNWEDYTGKEID